MADIAASVSSILGLNHNNFVVKDRDDRYVLVCQKGRYGTEHNELRGTIIDLDRRCVVAGPSSRIIECTQSSVELADTSTPHYALQADTSTPHYALSVDVLPNSVGNARRATQAEFHSQSRDNKSHSVTIPVDKITFEYGIEGTNIIVWQDHLGAVRVSSHNKLNIVKSCPTYGTSHPFFEYFRFNDINLEKLYRPGRLSCVVHRFIIQYADVAACCKRNAEGNLAYDGYFVQRHRVFHSSVSDSSAVTVPSEVNSVSEIDDVAVPYEAFLPRFTKRLDEVVGCAQPTVLILGTKLDLDEANLFLRYGYYELCDERSTTVVDLRTLPSEFIYARVADLTYRIKSEGWQWRFLMQRFPNTLHNAFYMFNYAHSPFFYASANFPHHYYQDDAELRRKTTEGIPIITLSRDNGQLIDLTTYEGRLYNITLCLLLAVPIAQQKIAIGVMFTYVKLCEWAAIETLALVSEPIPTTCSKHRMTMHNQAVQIVANAYAYTQSLNPPLRVTVTTIIITLNHMHGGAAYSYIRELKLLRGSKITNTD